MRFPFRLLAVFAIGLAGCVAPGSKGVGTAIVLSDVPLKESGPHQITPASSSLRKGDRVSVQRVVGDFVEVETADGRRGYIPYRAIRGE